MNVEETLKMLGIDYREASGEFRAPCPQHKVRTGHEDANPSWYISAESGLSLCFSCNYRANLPKLIADVRGIDLGQAQALLVEQRQEVDSSTIRSRLEKATSWVYRKRDTQFLPESSLAQFDAPPAWALAERRITAEAAQDYGVRWEDSTGSWILPIRDPWTDNLLGWQIKSQVQRGLVRNWPRGIKKSGAIFGLDAISSPVLWVVESPLDAVRLSGLPGDGICLSAVATFGASVSKEQMRLLRAYDRLILAFDNDDAGARATDEFIAANPGADILVATYPKGCKDPGDCTDDQLQAIRPRHAVRL